MRNLALTLAGVLTITAGPVAQTPAPTGYLTPPKAIADIMDAAPNPTVVVSPTNDVMLLISRRSMPSIAEISRPMLRLAGERIDPQNNGPHLMPSGTGITVRSTLAVNRETTSQAGQTRPVPVRTSVEITVPANARIGNVSFSPDGKRFAFTNTRDTRIDLYIADVANGRARLVDDAINGLNGACDWLADSSGLVCGFVPAPRSAAPAEPKVPAGPNIQENHGKPGPIPTFEDMLENGHDEDLFEYYFTAQLGYVDAATARRTPIGRPAPIGGFSASPNGQFLLVEKIKRPFSHLLTWEGFPKDVEIWTRRGDKARTIADVPMSDTVPINGVIIGPRAYRWNPVDPATLVWVEALDKGDIRNKVPNRDRVMVLKAPFTGEPTEAGRTEFRYGGVSWTDKGTIFLTENDRATRTTRTWLLTSSWSEPRRLWDRKQQDSYSNPGTPMLRPRKGTVMQVGDTVFLSGQGASPDGDRPFLDRLNLTTLKTERLFRSDASSYETVVSLMDDNAAKVLTRYETRKEPPNYYVRDLAAGSRTAVTEFKDPHPQITAAERMFVTYKRKDGVQLSGTIYLPPGYKQGERVPMFVWAYPREFVDAGAASQVTGSPNRFTFVTGASHLLLLTQGYAIFDGPTMPIVGPGETANDSYVEQLVSSAQAAVDKAVELGIADRARVGVGGHSYGAFMTANLLAHSDIFAAGIARSGAYNRSLTPFGFQSETRTFWEIPEIYGKMSPFFNAQKINEPILLIHGEADDNSGTFPIQSERLYMALKGHGATVRYVTLPNEAHGYAARETNMHVITEMVNWLDKYVKTGQAKRTTDSVSK